MEVINQKLNESQELNLTESADRFKGHMNKYLDKLEELEDNEESKPMQIIDAKKDALAFANATVALAKAQLGRDLLTVKLLTAQAQSSLLQ